MMVKWTVMVSLFCTGMIQGMNVQESFERFKSLLRGSTEHFYVICVARSDNNVDSTDMDVFDITFLEKFIHWVIEGGNLIPFNISEISRLIKDLYNTYHKQQVWEDDTWTKQTISTTRQPNYAENKACQYAKIIANFKDQKQSNAVIDWQDIRDASGLIVFNEHFFGHAPIPKDIAISMAERFSFNNKLTAINFSTQERGSLDDCMKFMGEFLKELKEPSNSRIYSNEITTFNYEKANESAAKNKLKAIRNITHFVHGGRIVANYEKFTYNPRGISHIENLVKEAQAYICTGSKTSWHESIESDPSGIGQSLHQVLLPQICSDYEFGQTIDNSKPLIQLVQSNTITVNPQSANNIAPWLIHCDPGLTNTFEELRAYDYFKTYEDEVLRGLLTHSVYKKNENNELVPQASLFDFHFVLENTKYVITITKIDNRT